MSEAKKKSIFSFDFNTRSMVGLGLFTAIVIVLQYVSMAIRFGTFSITLALVPIVIGAALFGVWAGAWLGLVFGIVVLLSGDANYFMGFNAFGTVFTVLLKGVLSGFCAGLVYNLLPKGRAFDRTAIIISDALLILGGVALLLVGIHLSNNLPQTDTMAVSNFGLFCKIFGIVIGAVGLAFMVYLIVKKPKFSMPISVFSAAIVSPVVNTGIFVICCRLFFYKEISELAGDSDFFLYIILFFVGMNFIFELAYNLVLSPAIVMLVKFGQKRFASKN